MDRRKGSGQQPAGLSKLLRKTPPSSSSGASFQTTGNGFAIGQPFVKAAEPVDLDATRPVSHGATAVLPSNKSRRARVPAHAPVDESHRQSSARTPPRTQTTHALGPNSRPLPSNKPLRPKASSEYAADTVGLYQNSSFGRSMDENELHRARSDPPRSSSSLVVPRGLHGAIMSKPLSIRDPQTILHLMQTISGTLKGNIYWRRNSRSHWSNSFAYIDLEHGDLRRRHGPSETFEILIRDLRCCTVHVLEDLSLGPPSLRVSPYNDNIQIWLQPEDPKLLDAWFAAFLCWRATPLRKSILGRPAARTLMTLSELSQPVQAEISSNDSPRPSQSEATIKAGDALFIDPSVHVRSPSIDLDASQDLNEHPKVLCVLRSNGQLTIQDFLDRDIIATLDLTRLPRSAIRRLEKSAFDQDHTIALYPQYANPRACSRIQPIVLALGSRESLETWFVLLRAFAFVEFFGSQRLQKAAPGLHDNALPGITAQSNPIFRIEHTVELRVIRFKSNPRKDTKNGPDGAEKRSSGRSTSRTKQQYYAEICFDEHVQACTPKREGYGEAYWATNHNFFDLPSRLSTITIRVMQNDPDGAKNSTPPSLCGEASINMTDSELADTFDGSLPLMNSVGEPIGEISLSIRHLQETILMEHEYDQISQLLEDHGKNLSFKINEHLSTTNLHKLAESFLNIFHVSDQTEAWIMSLVEQELGGARPVSIDLRDSTLIPLPSAETKEAPPASRPGHIPTDAVLLFRGNTLLTKALDLHMKRVGRAWLEGTLGSKMREIAEGHDDYEVDPNRLPADADPQANFKKLIDLTTEVWELIRYSAYSCPPELCAIFRHIRMCARRRFGDTAPAVNYTSVSGFLFLRFFCAAILSPQLFGLVDDSYVVNPQAHRAFMLVAKALQGLANLSTFGNKEPWMAPMNGFCSSHRDEFKAYIDAVCAGPDGDDVDLVGGGRRTSASEAAVLMVVDRLPLHAREGFPSLPYLIDGPRNLASLVNLWLDNAGDAANPTHRASVASTVAGKTADTDLARFHSMCVSLRATMQSYLQQAETTIQRVDSSIAQRWVRLAEQMETQPREFWRRDWSPSASTEDLASASLASEQRPNTDSVISLSTERGRTSKHEDSAGLKSRAFMMFGWDSSKADKREKEKQQEPSPPPSRYREKSLNRDDISRKSSRSADLAPPEPSSNAAIPRSAARPGSIMTSVTNRSGGSKKSSKSRKHKSPPRNEQDNAMRKLGFI